MPPVEHVRDRVPAGQVRLSYDHRRDEVDIQECDRHAAVPPVSGCHIFQEDDVRLGVRPALFYGQKRVRHALETVFG